mmetsp:Transcript_4037/g.5670  ORF Transcript_4037/g.5670 Transcript_4037/m.5670 type:complete len:123 (-) Transcript_4037:275-643(-)|eukprot:CAMPEP_0197285918 /NCGR_PEP_ID=MMETSP0890-20130614/1284_1 /TAXON_ID=44058 ORGANISM="Aureoumbra lagunensis, Strain CCMP1510" /NCGR_SAMPLE_ID=MMETSP0890 /ASSEMBLY_ACC=CAM_ASM_000533 /LENGTH=122 /DNA_ID=CAMNT_0042753829 /DNA_START=107 /DNA_END=475 /DNA_ORIENTATION=+
MAPPERRAAFDARKSMIQEDKLGDWLREPITLNLQQVPGIGPANERILGEAEGEDKVETTHQLIGKFLSLKGKDVTPVEHCDMFWHWLAKVGVNAGRNNVVLAIAEKCEVFVPGVYDASAYQ